MLEFNSVEELKSAYNTGDSARDMEVINAYMSGDVSIRQQDNVEQQPVHQEAVQDHVVEQNENVQQSELNTNNEHEEVIEQPINPYQDEVERLNRYTETLKQRSQEETERILFEKRQKEEELERERQMRIEMEQRIKALEAQAQHSTVEVQDEEDDEYLSPATIRLREDVKKLREASVNPEVIDHLVKSYESLNSDWQKEKSERKAKADAEAQAAAKQRSLNSLRDLYSKNPELKPSRDIADIDRDVVRLENDIAYVAKQTGQSTIDAINDYFNGGDVRRRCDAMGIKPIDQDDYNKYNALADLIDLKNGFKYDARTGKKTPVLDESGRQVCYANLEEAYVAKNYKTLLEKTIKQTNRQFADQVSKISSGPVLLDGTRTSQFNNEISADTERMVLRWTPNDWKNDPEKKKLATEVYKKHGLSLPSYGGR